MKLKILALACFVTLGFGTSFVPLASAHSSSSSYRSASSVSRSNYDSSARIRYDSNGNAYLDTRSSNSSSRSDRSGNMQPSRGRLDCRHGYSSNSSSGANFSVSGRIRYDNNGVAYWAYDNAVDSSSSRCN